MSAEPTLRILVVGDGRAGGSFAQAWRRAGVAVDGPHHHDELLAPGAPALVDAVDLVLLAVPDGALEATAATVPDGPAVLAHCAGAHGLDVLGARSGVGSIHPLVSLPDPEAGGRALAGAWFATAHRGEGPGGRRAAEVIDAAVGALRGRAVPVADGDRIAYHAAAAMAANHLVALLGQVDRIAAEIGVPLDAYLDLARGALDNVAERGPAAALTGPVSRGDWDTVAAHLAAIDPDERLAYAALADAARRLRPPPHEPSAPLDPDPGT